MSERKDALSIVSKIDELEDKVWDYFIEHWGVNTESDIEAAHLEQTLDFIKELVEQELEAAMNACSSEHGTPEENCSCDYIHGCLAELRKAA